MEFSCESAAQEALDMTGFYMGKRFIAITKPMVPRAMVNMSMSTSTSEGESNKKSKTIEAPAGKVSCLEWHQHSFHSIPVHLFIYMSVCLCSIAPTLQC